jgi:hypothetical protein
MIAQPIQVDRAVFDEVIQALGNRRFLRCPIARSDDLEVAVRTALARSEPIEVVILWGKGNKRQPDLAEKYAARFLARYAERVRRTWSPGVRYSALFADTHARLNGYGDAESQFYFRKVRSILGSVVDKFGFLSDLWGTEINWDALARRAAVLDDREWVLLDARMNLLRGAVRHSVRGDPVRLARLYYVVRRAEARLLARAFPGCLYGTYEGAERDSLQPDLPVLHIYSWARGRSVRPWNAAIPEARCAEDANALEPCAA